jgi:hypothetical protein
MTASVAGSTGWIMRRGSEGRKVLMEGKLSRARWPNGARVQVRNRFDGSWASGFEVERQGESGDDLRASYLLRRISDGSVLPIAFDEGEISPEH